MSRDAITRASLAAFSQLTKSKPCSTHSSSAARYVVASCWLASPVEAVLR